MSEKRNGDEDDWFLGDEDAAIVYMCGVDWRHHTLCDARGARIYGSENIAKNNRDCLGSCGLVEIEMKVRRWVKPQNLRPSKDNAQG